MSASDMLRGQGFKLFIIHCGYYEELGGGKFEMHVNLPVIAEAIESARAEVKLHPDFIAKKMHVDGVQPLQRVGEYLIDVVHRPE